ncbi:unnamed protein product [Nippostrongylus brasiliensis]|uniref:Lysosomal-associated transmembrane protein 4A n=1 Tax=Nippostrongylus brasiliensis TaxID=27835 RepID=A0A0N4XTL8_NIPBR|nr:unnamed protein product [Nippostrongylus brasiliensis]
MDLDITRDHTTLDSRGLTNLSSTCFVSPKATGIVSLILQFALLVVSVLVVLFFFYHIGGYDYMGGNENSTAVPPISTYLPLDSSAAIYEELSANDTEKFPETAIGTQLDMLELIRISTFIYVVLCILWLISIAFLLLSIKFEVLDMVILNAVFLSIASTYALVHALFIAVLLYYQVRSPFQFLHMSHEYPTQSATTHPIFL